SLFQSHQEKLQDNQSCRRTRKKWGGRLPLYLSAWQMGFAQGQSGPWRVDEKSGRARSGGRMRHNRRLPWTETRNHIPYVSTKGRDRTQKNQLVRDGCK